MRAGACSSRNDRRASTWPGAGNFRAARSPTVRTSSRLLRASCARSSGSKSPRRGPSCASSTPTAIATSSCRSGSSSDTAARRARSRPQRSSGWRPRVLAVRICSKPTGRSSKRCGICRRPGRGPLGGHCSAVYNALKAHSRRQPVAAPTELPEIQLDSKALYREDVFTDRRAGSIRRLTPVTADGAPDPTRHVLFSGQTQLLTPAGVLPLGFEIEAATLEEALKKFPAGVKDALEQAIDEARELRREAASRIVVPEVGGAVGPAPGRGRRKIKFP